MDETLKAALDFSNFNQTLNTQRRLIKEKLESRLIYGHGGGIFKIDRSLIVFVQMLIDQGRIENVPIVDINDNPVMVPDLEKFRDEIFDRYFSATTDYLNEFNKIKKSRSVEKLVDL
jgi:hypothetical protein